MASKKISMAEELLNAVTEPFTKVVCKLHDSRITSIENFKIKKTDLMKSHWIDSTLLLSSDKKVRLRQVFLRYLLTEQD